MTQKTWCLEKRSTKETEKKSNNKSRKRKEHTLIKQEQN